MRLWEQGNLQVAFTAMMASEILLHGPTRSGSREAPAAPYAPGVVGVGIWRSLAVALVARDQFSGPLEPVPAMDIPEVRQPLLEALRFVPGSFDFPNMNPLSNLFVLMVPPPEIRVSSGDSLRGVKTGRVGCPVSWTKAGSKTHGFLTVAHVVGTGSHVTVGGAAAPVVFARSFDLSGTTPEVDVAVVETGTPISSGITGVGAGAALTPLDTLLGGGSPGNEVTGSLTFLYFPKVKGTAKSLYMAEPSVTVGGDSGAPVVLRNSRHLSLGHLVGGSGTQTDYIQSVDDQLADIRSRMKGHASGLDTITI